MMALVRNKKLAAVAAVYLVVSTTYSFSPTTNLPRNNGLRTRGASTVLRIADLPDKHDDSGLSYGERSRPFRRDVFNYDLWVNHRSTDRFIGNLLDILKSSVVRQLFKDLVFISSVAAFVCVYNGLLVTGYDDFASVHHDALAQGFPIMKMSGQFFALTSPALALLLGT